MDSFNRIHDCSFDKSQREIDIDERFKMYYEDASLAETNHQVSMLWYELVKWCKECGYSNSEINLAKRRSLR